MKDVINIKDYDRYEVLYLMGGIESDDFRIVILNLSHSWLQSKEGGLSPKGFIPYVKAQLIRTVFKKIPLINAPKITILGWRKFNG